VEPAKPNALKYVKNKSFFASDFSKKQVNTVQRKTRGQDAYPGFWFACDGGLFDVVGESSPGDDAENASCAKLHRPQARYDEK